MALGYGLALLVCAALLHRRGAPRVLPALTAASGALVLASVPLAERSATLAEPVLLLGVAVALPLAVVLFPDGGHLQRAGWPATAVVGATGLLVALTPAYAAAYALGGGCLLLAALWWRIEVSDPPERVALLWFSLVAGTGLLLAGFLVFLDESARGEVLAALACLAVPAGLVVGVVAPAGVDVRAAVTRTVVEATTLVTAVAVYVGVISAVELVGGQPPSSGAQGVVAALCALLHHPVRLQLMGVMDTLIFGEREGPVEAATHVGRTLTEPVLALRALRESLSLPYAALLTDAGTLASSGPQTAAFADLDLPLGEDSVGQLRVGLRPGELRLSRHDRTVLEVVTPALAQAVHAHALSQALQQSRASVITAVEDERRRLRHDLHDSVGPTLTGIAFAADAARNTLNDPDRARALLTTLRADTADALDEVRRVVEALRPPAVDELGLVGALRQQVVGMPGLAVQLHAEHLPPLPAAVEVAAYRIVNEALTNVRRHSGSGTAWVTLAQDGTDLLVQVRDSGVGDAPWEPGVGLGSMRERTEQLGGTFSAGGGLVRARLPVGAA